MNLIGASVSEPHTSVFSVVRRSVNQGDTLLHCARRLYLKYRNECVVKDGRYSNSVVLESRVLFLTSYPEFYIQCFRF